MVDNKEVEKTLKALKLKIQKSKEDLVEAKTKKRILLNTLKKDFNIENLIEAEENVKKLTKELDLLTTNIEKSYIELKDKFNFI